MKPLSADEREQVNRTGSKEGLVRFHNYADTVRGWGHDRRWDKPEGDNMRGSFHNNYNPAVGEYLIFSVESKKIGKMCLYIYRITKLEPCGNPRDMYFFEAVFDRDIWDNFFEVFMEGHVWDKEVSEDEALRLLCHHVYSVPERFVKRKVAQ